MSLIRKYDQIEIHTAKDPDSVDVYLTMPFLRQPLKKGTLYRNGLLKLTPKSRVNIFKMFGEGIGINEEMILRLNFKLIECEINGKLYRTTKEQLLKKGIRSPYQNSRVDRQVILRLEDFYIPAKPEPEEKELTLFAEVVHE